MESLSFGSKINVAWLESQSRELAVVVLDNSSAWGARRKMVAGSGVSCPTIFFNADEEHQVEDLEDALIHLESFQFQEIRIIAFDATVVPALAVFSSLRPTKVKLINPQPCRNTSLYEVMIEENIKFIRCIPSIKVIIDGDHDFSLEFVRELERIAPQTSQLKLSGISDFSSQMVRYPSYVKSFANI